MENRKAAIEWFKKLRDSSPMAGARGMFDMAIAALEQQRWIPVTDGLPELDTEVLVTDQWRDIWHATYTDWCGSERFISAEESLTIEGVIAWRPLPEPYQEDEA